jgi:tRNA(adenine34) deaminase
MRPGFLSIRSFYSKPVFSSVGPAVGFTGNMEAHVQENLMRQALAEAQTAAAMGEVPIGCVILHEPTGRIVGTGANRRIIDHDPTAHAEILAIRQAAQTLGDWRLVDCVLAVTLEPCPMCAGALVNARVPRLVYGCDDPKAGAVRTFYQLCEDQRLNHRVEVTSGVLAEPCAEILREFFRQQRMMGKK